MRLAVPEQVIVSLAEFADQAQEGLLSLAVRTGLRVMSAMNSTRTWPGCAPLAASTTPVGRVPARSEAGSVTLGGRRVPVPRPRVELRAGAGSCPLPPMSCSPRPSCWAAWRWRRCSRACRPAGIRSGWNRRAGRRGADGHEQQVGGVAPVRGRDRDRADGADRAPPGRAEPGRVDDRRGAFRGHTCIVALGIDITGVKHPLAVTEGSTENTTVVRDLIAGLRERGLDTSRPILAVLDGAKELSRAVRDVFDRPLIHAARTPRSGTCRQAARPAKQVAEPRMRPAYPAGSALKPKASWSSWPANWTRPTPAPPPACAKA